MKIIIKNSQYVMYGVMIKMDNLVKIKIKKYIKLQNPAFSVL